MKYNRDIIYGMLRYFGDKQPHKYYEQHQLFMMRYSRDVKKNKINIINLMRYLVHNGLIMGYGDDFCKTYFPFRYFILTDKGDEYFRLLQIIRGGNYSYYKYGDRDKMKG
jgi:hypothetical protein